jgi:hypothetical protein
MPAIAAARLDVTTDLPTPPLPPPIVQMRGVAAAGSAGAAVRAMAAMGVGVPSQDLGWTPAARRDGRHDRGAAARVQLSA